MFRKWFFSLAVVCATAIPVVSQDNWSTKETPNFRVLHKDNDEQAAKAAKLAEEVRLKAVNKWFAGKSDWRTKCDLYLHPDSDSISRFGSPGWAAPGYMQPDTDPTGVVISRRVHVRLDYKRVWDAVLPHEINHAVTVGRWGTDLHKWIDEGMAGQMESEDVFSIHTHNVLVSKKNLKPIDEFIATKTYPKTNVAVFYAQSITFVGYLVSLKGEKEFVAFVDTAQTAGPEKALKKHYRMTPAEAESGWLEYLEEE